MADPVSHLILCGGSGARLWPLSRNGFPKRFTPPLAATTACSFGPQGGCPAPDLHPPRSSPAAISASWSDQTDTAGLTPGTILSDPSARNAAPAILAELLPVAGANPGALALVAPSDHLVPDPAAFRAAVTASVPASCAGQVPGTAWKTRAAWNLC